MSLGSGLPGGSSAFASNLSRERSLVAAVLGAVGEGPSSAAGLAAAGGGGGAVGSAGSGRTAGSAGTHRPHCITAVNPVTPPTTARPKRIHTATGGPRRIARICAVVVVATARAAGPG